MAKAASLTRLAVRAVLAGVPQPWPTTSPSSACHWPPLSSAFEALSSETDPGGQVSGTLGQSFKCGPSDHLPISINPCAGMQNLSELPPQLCRDRLCGTGLVSGERGSQRHHDRQPWSILALR